MTTNILSMKYYPDAHHRQSLRLKGYNYSLAGLYFITIRTNRKQKLFGDIINEVMIANDAGDMVNNWFIELAKKFPDTVVECRMIMPDHIHFIICLGTICKNNPIGEGAHTGAPLHEIIQWFKTMTTNEYISGVKKGVYHSFDRKIWQRGYHDHIIRNEHEMREIRKYIKDNPQNADAEKTEWMLHCEGDWI